jgi:multidrug transporter EmrE-like cation transporter
MVRIDASRDSNVNDHDENDNNGVAHGHDNDIEMTATTMHDPNSNETELLIPAGGDNDTNAKIRGARKSSSSTQGNGSTSVAAIPARRKVRRVMKNDAATTSSSSTDKDENAQAICIKYSALFLLVAQMVGLVLLMRYSRVASSTKEGPLYLASTAVFVMEVMKLVICFGVVFYQMSGNIKHFVHEMHHHTIDSPIEMMKLTIPSLLYTVQNNLLYLALTNLDAATYQVCYQLKILTTALFSAVLLQRTFSCMKWISLIVLTVGVAIVQLSGSSDKNQHAANSDHHDAVRDLADQMESHNRFIGLVAVICAACTSGFSGVYFGAY